MLADRPHSCWTRKFSVTCMVTAARYSFGLMVRDGSVGWFGCVSIGGRKTVKADSKCAMSSCFLWAGKSTKEREKEWDPSMAEGADSEKSSVTLDDEGDPASIDQETCNVFSCTLGECGTLFFVLYEVACCSDFDRFCVVRAIIAIVDRMSFSDNVHKVCVTGTANARSRSIEARIDGNTLPRQWQGGDPAQACARINLPPHACTTMHFRHAFACRVLGAASTCPPHTCAAACMCRLYSFAPSAYVSPAVLHVLLPACTASLALMRLRVYMLPPHACAAACICCTYMAAYACSSSRQTGNAWQHMYVEAHAQGGTGTCTRRPHAAAQAHGRTCMHHMHAAAKAHGRTCVQQHMHTAATCTR